MNSTITLKKITKKDTRFLFDLLRERKSYENISHNEMPSYKEHIKFVSSKPYSQWYVIYSRNKKTAAFSLLFYGAGLDRVDPYAYVAGTLDRGVPMNGIPQASFRAEACLKQETITQTPLIMKKENYDV